MGLISRHAAPRLVIPKLIGNIASVPAAAAGPAPTLAFAGATNDTSNASAYTFTNHAISTAASDRYVVVVAVATDSSTAGKVSSITIGGNTATMHRNDERVPGGGSVELYSAIYGLTVTSGTTATIVVTYSTAKVRCGIAVYALYGLTSTTEHHGNSNNGAGTSISTTLNIPSQGIAIAGSICASNNADHSATGLTEDTDTSPENPTRFIAMSASNMSSETGRTITATGTASTSRIISAASWV